MLQDLNEYYYSLLGTCKNLYLICKRLGFGLCTGLPVSKEYNVPCCNTYYGINHAAGTQCCMTQHCDADQRANSAPNPSHSTVLGTHKHSRIPGCNLVNTLRAVPEQYGIARRLPTTLKTVSVLWLKDRFNCRAEFHLLYCKVP